MKFKSPSDEPIYVCLTSGHAAWIGAEWRELPLMLHREAMMNGCITDNMAPETISEMVEAAKPGESHHDKLVAVIKAMMDKPEQGDFTQNDLPNMKRIKALVDFDFTKDEMMQAVYAIGRENEAA